MKEQFARDVQEPGSLEQVPVQRHLIRGGAREFAVGELPPFGEDQRPGRVRYFPRDTAMDFRRFDGDHVRSRQRQPVHFAGPHARQAVVVGIAAGVSSESQTRPMAAAARALRLGPATLLSKACMSISFVHPNAGNHELAPTAARRSVIRVRALSAEWPTGHRSPASRRSSGSDRSA